MASGRCGATWSALNPPFNGAAPANLTAVNKITNLFTGRPALGLCLGSADDLRHGRLGFANIKGQYENANTAVEFNPAFSGQSRNNGWYAGGGFEYMVHKGPLVDVILGAEYQHFDVRSTTRLPTITVIGAPNTFDQDAKGDIVRARLTIKTQGYGYFEITNRFRDQPHNGPGQPPGAVFVAAA